MTSPALDIREYPGRWALALLLVLTVVPGLTMPGVDLSLSGRFYQPGIGFTWDAEGGLEFVRSAAPDIIIGSFGLCVLLWVAGLFNVRLPVRMTSPRIIFLLSSLLIGPGLIVEGILKPVWGRARPKDIDVFGGEQTYTLPWQVANECAHNCSFASGHVAVAFWLTAYAYLLPRRWRLAGMGAGVAVGLGMGWVRVSQGAHFFSDAIAAGLVVLLVNEVLAAVILRRRAES
jgi:lipid A 4'-phosphatase